MTRNADCELQQHQKSELMLNNGVEWQDDGK